jgi:ubiquinone/menaquinone biosynthesis C-methylase UbiE
VEIEEAMTDHPRHFVPAAGHDWLLPLYDPLQRLLGGDAARRRMVELAEIAPGHRVLDIGCGTGSLAALIAKRHPRVEIVGLDPDPKALARARRKCDRAGTVALDIGYSDALPYPDASFDRVLSSFMFHHLEAEAKLGTLSEAMRILAPGGALHLLDFGGTAENTHGLLGHLFHSAEHLRENFEGGIPALMREMGFAEAEEIDHRSSWIGRITYVRGRPPA